MRKIILIAISAAALVFSAFTFVASVNWQIKEDDYSIKFSTQKAKGVIKGLKGTINFDKNNLVQSNFDVTVDVNTLNTGIGLKNRHAKGSKFLDVAKYPNIRFVSTNISKSANAFIVKGRLNIKDVSREITIPFNFEEKGNEAVFKGNFEINRKHYNLEYRGVGEVIKIELLIPVHKK